MNAAMLRRRTGFTVAAILVAVVGVVLVYYGQVDTGLYYDDYHFVRPLRSLELRRLWFGSWDPTGVESPFFRPLTASLFALRFWLFGLNTQAMHAVSMAGHVACAVMVGWLLRREDTISSVALLGTWLYAIHPVFPYAQASWLTNQMHLMESVIVLATLMTWQSVRDRHIVWWICLLPLAVAAFLIKEDAVMLLPVVVALTIARMFLLRPERQRGWWLALVAAPLAVAALIAFRQQRLGQLGGYAVPDFQQAQTNFWKGIDAAVLLWPTRTPWQGVASVIAIVTVLSALFAGRRGVSRGIAASAVSLIVVLAFALPALRYEIDYPLVTWQGVASGAAVGILAIGLGTAIATANRTALFVMSAGLVVALGFDLPFALVSKREQYHLLGLGAVLLLSGAGEALASTSASNGHVRIAVLALAVAAPFALLARSQAADFRPCATPVLDVDPAAASWWVVPVEVKGWLARKPEMCRDGGAPGRVSDLPLVAWGLYGEERASDGESYRWTSDTAVVLIRWDIRSLTLAVRRPGASASTPVNVDVRGAAVQTIRLDSDQWQTVTLPLADGLLTRLRASHRIDIRVTPWFVPAVLDPKSPDLRRLGVQLRLKSE